MATRILTGSIYDISENARPDFALQVVVSPTAITPTGIIPESTEPIATDDDGNFNIEVVTGIQLEVRLSDAFRRIGTTTNFGNGNIIKRGMVVPHGVSPITVQAVLALNTDPDAPTDLIDLANEHIGNRDNPHETILAQLDTSVTGTELDAMAGKLAMVADGATANATDADLRDRTTHTGEQAISTITGLEARLDAIDDDFGDLSDVATSGSYGDLIDVPAAFPPSPHSHGMGDVTGLGGALNLKANTADLGSAAFANSTAFATSAQGLKADSAVQPAALDGLNADRHTHTNKSILDGITAPNLAPNGGLVGQVLTVGASERQWQDVPGIVYPSLLLSPDGSFGRNGPVTPTIGSGVTVVAGQYGNAWLLDGSSTVLLPAVSGLGEDSGSILMRVRIDIDPGVPGSFLFYISGGEKVWHGLVGSSGGCWIEGFGR